MYLYSKNMKILCVSSKVKGRRNMDREMHIWKIESACISKKIDYT